MTRTLTSALVAASLLVAASAAGATSRIKDIADVEGVRENQLVGYGLVVGLNGTGDTPPQLAVHPAVAAGMLERLGVNTRGAAAPHRQRRRRDGHGQPAGLRRPGHAASTSRSRRSATPRACRAARCWSRRCSAPTARSMPSARARSRSAGFQARGRRRHDHARRADRRPHRQRRHRRARDRVRAQPADAGAAGAAQPRPHHRPAHRRGDQRLPRRADRRAARSVDRAAHRPAQFHGQRGRAAHRDRAAAGRARPRRRS